MIRRVTGKPAVIVKRRHFTLVVGDLHIGLGRLPVEFLVDELMEIIFRVSPQKMIILGDLKHGIGMRKRELNTIANVLREAREFVDEIFIVKGNHDGKIEERFDNVIDARGFIFDGVGYFHGHAWPREEILNMETIISAHTHPTIHLRDEVGVKRDRVWIEWNIDNKRCLILPAFNPLCRGSVLNGTTMLSPGVIIKEEYFPLGNADIYLLDGTYLGPLELLTHVEP
jgi:hypothetical protein